MHGQAGEHEHMAGVSLFLLVTVFLFTYLILTFYNPEIVRRTVNGHKTDENDQVLTMIWALVISLVILFLLGLLWYCFYSGKW